MEERFTYTYIYFGTTLRFLLDVEEGWVVKRGSGSWVLGNLKYFLEQLDTLELTVTGHVAFHEGLPDLRDELEALPDGARLTADQAKRLKAAIANVRKTLDAESQQKTAFVVSEKRWDIKKLLNDPGAFFAPGVFSRLPDVARYDLREAGKCIAFERPTAVAFHLMRATEAVLRSFYCHTVKRDRLPEHRRMWGPMVDQLRSRRKPPPAPLLNNLDNIRDSYRNPTQHPDAVYDIQQAQDLFGLCIEVINRMAAEGLA